MIKLLVLLDENNIVADSEGKNFAIPETQWADFIERFGEDDFLVGGVTYREMLAMGDDAFGKGQVYVLTRRVKVEGATAINSTKDALKLFDKYRAAHKTLWVLGGKAVYEALYHDVDVIYASVSNTKYPADVKLEWDLSKYLPRLIKESAEFKVYEYVLK